MFDGKTYRFHSVALRTFKDLEQNVTPTFESDAQGFVDREGLHPERRELYDTLLLQVATGRVVDLGVSEENRLQADPTPPKRTRRGKRKPQREDVTDEVQVPKRYTPAEIKANLGPGVYLKWSDMTVWDYPDEGGPDLYIFVPELDPDES